MSGHNNRSSRMRKSIGQLVVFIFFFALIAAYGNPYALAANSGGGNRIDGSQQSGSGGNSQSGPSDKGGSSDGPGRDGPRRDGPKHDGPCGSGQDGPNDGPNNGPNDGPGQDGPCGPGHEGPIGGLGSIGCPGNNGGSPAHDCQQGDGRCRDADNRDTSYLEEPLVEEVVEIPIKIEEPIAIQQPVVIQQPEKVVRHWLLHFDFDKSVLRPLERSILDDLIRFYNENPGSTFTLVGHTDGFGTDFYNIALSQRRVRAAQKYLIDRGVQAAHLSIDAKGESEPVASNDNSAHRALNRRVTVKLDD